jgi:hypothetical protein
MLYRRRDQQLRSIFYILSMTKRNVNPAEEPK